MTSTDTTDYSTEWRLGWLTTPQGDAMFIVDDRVIWSASDLASAARCEYAVLRTLDYKLHRAEPLDTVRDPLETHIAALGDAYEADLLEERRQSGSIAELPRAEQPLTAAGLHATATATIEAFDAKPDVLYQPAFFDGEFFGYADFVEHTPDGWLVADAKLARHAKPQALLQLAAYADQIDTLARAGSIDLPLAPTVSLLLGSGQRADFPIAEITPVFLERRARLRALLDTHRARGRAVVWGEPNVAACGRCPECAHAAETHNDLLLVAGMRMEQRRRLHEVGITDVAELAAVDPTDESRRPERMAAATFANLALQARLQWQQAQVDHDVPLWVPTADAVGVLAQLPPPSPGDLFFDFEGDPLYYEFDRSRTGLEYLWGVMDAQGSFEPTWAHDWAEERAAFIAFIDRLTARLVEYPDMHVYHYAAYETSALKRLAMRYQVREDALDDLLRAEVFVDLYATVRGAIRVATQSYSIKKLEPLYMGTELRADDADAVAEGAGSVVAYHEYRSWRHSDPTRAQARLESLADYNEYDCLSTLRLRDWLLERARELNVRSVVGPHGAPDDDGAEAEAGRIEGGPVFDALMAKAEPAPGTPRTPGQQAYAMLATALDYYRREHKQFWWEHFDRLHSWDSDRWGARDVFIVESAQVISDWAVPLEGRSKKAQRQVRLVGQWTPGSKAAADTAQVVYCRRKDALPGYEFPPGTKGPDSARYRSSPARSVTCDPDNEQVVWLVETCDPADEFDDLPVALVPGRPLPSHTIEEAVAEVAEVAAFSDTEPQVASWDVLARRVPRLRGGNALPQLNPAEDTWDTVVAALLAMDSSYLAVQGPPGTGKTYTGGRVIKKLVEDHNWRIGVVAQSHAAVENMLDAVVQAGLDPARVGKSKPRRDEPEWTVVTDSSQGRARFLSTHGDGCVLGGTAWTFANAKGVGRGQLDLLVIDEAGQFSLAPTLGAAAGAQRLLLLGDPQQLPQVTQGTHAEPVDESALGWLLDGRATIPPEYGYLLAESRRMHPQLCQRVSQLSYEGRLSPEASVNERFLEGVEPGLRVVTVDHVGNSTESTEEADAAVQVVREAIGRTWTAGADAAPRPLTESDFIVVAPFNAQVQTIRRALDDAGFAGVPVGTVDNFQGQEAAIAIVSMTASSHDDVPRGMGFLLNRNRINLAVSRGQWCSVLVRSDALSSYMPTTAEGVLELGAFLALAQYAGTSP